MASVAPPSCPKVETTTELAAAAIEIVALSRAVELVYVTPPIITPESASMSMLVNDDTVRIFARATEVVEESL
jgi:hypothetical protein